MVIIYWICWFLNWQDDLLFTLFSSFHFARITIANQTVVRSLLIRYHQSLLVRSCHSVAQASWHSRCLCTFNFKFKRFTGFYHFLSDTENWENYTSTSQSSWFFCLNHSDLFQPFQGLFPQLCASPLFLLKEPELHSSKMLLGVFVLFLFQVQLWVMLTVVHAKYKLPGYRHRNSLQLLVRP